MAKRTVYCGLVSESLVGQEITLKGWVSVRRDLGGVIFIDLRDREGFCQVVFNREYIPQQMEEADRLRSEHVIEVTGQLNFRDKDQINPKIPTGQFELLATSLTVLSKSKTPPIYVDETSGIDEEKRLQYRYLDLRSPRMFNNLRLRHNVVSTIRSYLNDLDFLEVETPVLTKSTPEGARDYLVPTRREPNAFFALPQSPQIYKQLLMAAGIDRYYQIVKCFRDEDLRGDRQPEFTQMDMEMSFVQPEDIREIIEGMLKAVIRYVLGRDLEETFPVMTYDEAMNVYGSDKPDTRYGMTLKDLTDFARDCDFGVFRNAVEAGGSVKAINLKGQAQAYTRKTADQLFNVVKPFGAKGLAWTKITEEGFNGPIAKFLGDETSYKTLTDRLDGEVGDILFFVADQPEIVNNALGALRVHLARDHQLADPDALAFLWIIDWPLLEYDEELGRYVAMHHPFTSPVDPDPASMQADPASLRAQAYDIVLNGYEIGGGSIRIHNPETQRQMFDLLGFSPQEVQDQFGFLIQAMDYGFPPHGGIALGLDRLVMLLAKEPNIREVIAFPKAGSGIDLMSQAPSQVANDQLRELHLAIKPNKRPQDRS